MKKNIKNTMSIRLQDESKWDFSFLITFQEREKTYTLHLDEESYQEHNKTYKEKYGTRLKVKKHIYPTKRITEKNLSIMNNIMLAVGLRIIILIRYKKNINALKRKAGSNKKLFSSLLEQKNLYGDIAHVSWENSDRLLFGYHNPEYERLWDRIAFLLTPIKRCPGKQDYYHI